MRTVEEILNTVTSSISFSEKNPDGSLVSIESKPSGIQKLYLEVLLDIRSLLIEQNTRKPRQVILKETVLTEKEQEVLNKLDHE